MDGRRPSCAPGCLLRVTSCDDGPRRSERWPTPGTARRGVRPSCPLKNGLLLTALAASTLGLARALSVDHPEGRDDTEDRDDLVVDLLTGPAALGLLAAVVDGDVLDASAVAALDGAPTTVLSPLRRLPGSLTAPLGVVAGLLAEVGAARLPERAGAWHRFAAGARGTDAARRPFLEVLRASEDPLAARVVASVEDRPELRYPTSPYRDSTGHVVSSPGDDAVEAVAVQRTFTSLRVVEDVLDPAQPLLASRYAPLGRCVALVDDNVERHHGDRLDAYFAVHGITLHKRVHRAMEVDKGIATVERMLGQLKVLGVARHEPVLVVGGGVLTDTAGLACALFHRGTPYVMLSTSLVAGVDAGPSPRTCCDGFGYKNLFGAYHPPVLSITDRTFFATLEEGWLRHGIAEIAKMAIVKDADLFALLEQAGPELVRTRFATTGGDDALADTSRRVLGGAIRSYVEAEYGNLHETHQARPHAYGHTWSPGFEIAGGLLHGHAVSIGMGLGAFLSNRLGWLDDGSTERVLALLSRFGLALWHDVLDDHDLLRDAQARMVQKRGGHLAAPLPRGRIGACDYLDVLPDRDLRATVAGYRDHVATMPRGGRGIEPLCVDVGLEDPSTVAGDPPVVDLRLLDPTHAA